MTPVAKTGLHCGGARGDQERRHVKVTPVAKTGLHCGHYLHPEVEATPTA